MSEHKLTVVIPAYNEEASLRGFLPEVIKFCNARGWELVLVDDGSTDSTGDILDEFSQPGQVSVIHHKMNRGYGGAIKSGISAADTDYVVTIDADGQHYLEDIESLYEALISSDADLMVGSRRGLESASMYRDIGKRIIRFVANLLLDVHIHDINSGMKIYNTKLAQRYLRLCPDSMAYSEVITLVFISRRHRVEEHPIRIRQRIAGESTIDTRTAFEAVMEILNIVVLFNPMRIFLPVSILSILLGVAWGLPIILKGDGVSVGAMLAIVTGIIFFFLALLAEQISLVRRDVGR
jgi:glycosyltransferase involved in cell wall biosynthesis